MNTHKNARMTFHGRLLMVRRIEAGEPVAEAARAAGISERRAYAWLARWRAEGKAGLYDRSSAPHHRPRQLARAREAEILALRRERLSARAIAQRLGIPRSTVGTVLRRHRLSRWRDLEPRLPVIRYERSRPGELVHIDTKKLGRIDGIGHRVTGDRRGRARGSGWEYLHVCVDDACRLAYTEILPAETGEACAGFLARAGEWFARHGVRIERLMTDNAFAYTHSRLYKAQLLKLGARHIRTRPYTPRTNGKAERFIQTAMREWLYARPYRSSSDRAADMTSWIHFYNHHRSHAGIKAQTPAAKLNNLLGNDT